MLNGLVLDSAPGHSIEDNIGVVESKSEDERETKTDLEAGTFKTDMAMYGMDVNQVVDEGMEGCYTSIWPCRRYDKELKKYNCMSFKYQVIQQSSAALKCSIIIYHILQM